MSTEHQMATIAAQLDTLAAQIRQLQTQLSHTRAAPGPTFPARPAGITQVATPPSRTGAEPTRTQAPKIRLASQLCLGCGLCARIAPRTFSLNPQTGKAEVTDEHGDPAGIIQMAIARCPAGALRYTS